MASCEDARVTALHSLNTLVSIVKPPPEESCPAECLTLLEDNLRPLLDGSHQPVASTSGSFSSEDVHLSVAREVAQVSKDTYNLPQLCFSRFN